MTRRLLLSLPFIAPIAKALGVKPVKRYSVPLNGTYTFSYESSWSPLRTGPRIRCIDHGNGTVTIDWAIKQDPLMPPPKPSGRRMSRLDRKLIRAIEARDAG